MGQIANCKHCGELTPIERRNDTCNTTVCQVCQSYVITDENNAIAEVSDKWLAEFWKAKYFGIFASDKKVLVVGVGNNLGFASEHIAANLAMTTLSHPPAAAFNTA